MQARPLLNGLPSAICLASFLTLSAAPSAARDIAVDEPATILDNVTIIGHRRNPADVPGSAHLVSQEDLKTFLQGDVMRVLRTVPGVFLQEEEGFGLRPNIGIRGSGLDRSARVAILEDGILIAPAPYSAPAAYYFPTQRRIYALEVLKGPAAVAVGPKTTGGAVNLISTPVPDSFAATADLRFGQHNTIDAHLNAGNRGRRFSWLVETVQAQNDGFKSIDGPVGMDMGPTGYDIDDYMVKLQLDSDPADPLYQSLRLKAGFTDQVSDETYLGLTDEDFWLSPNRRYAASAGDVFNSEHDQLQLSYVLESESNWRSEVTVYRNNFARNWFKLQSVDGTGIGSILEDTLTFANEFSYLTGSDSPDDAIVKRHNNREYYSQGLQAQLSWDFSIGNSEVGLTTGIRIHEDEEDRLQKEDTFRMQDMLLVLTSKGALGSTTNRVSSASANSYFIDSEIRNGNWILTPGLRFEKIDMQRLDFSTADPDRLQGPARVRTNSVSVLIPGFGALYELGERWRVFGGANKGFNPPAPGSSASEESSLNFEFGARFVGESTNLEAIYFINDYDNLVGTVTSSTGGDGQIGDQFDGGEVTVQGLELTADHAWPGIFGSRFDAPVSLQYTWTTEAEFGSAFDSGFDPWGDVQPGDELPYIPEHQIRATAGLEGELLAINVAANYVGKMRSTAGQGTYEPADTIQSHIVWDLLARWRFTDSLSTYVKVDNLMDETYVASRRPAGVRPGLERTAYIGLTFEL
ncbi:MAG: Fe(3+) dicitrate transport protein [Woeseiaceae bacterium]|jgi:Fe(3+) dicitrate transport protein